jgi:hypothetical protein
MIVHLDEIPREHEPKQAEVQHVPPLLFVSWLRSTWEVNSDLTVICTTPHIKRVLRVAAMRHSASAWRANFEMVAA